MCELMSYTSGFAYGLTDLTLIMQHFRPENMEFARYAERC